LPLKLKDINDFLNKIMTNYKLLAIGYCFEYGIYFVKRLIVFKVCSLLSN